MFCAFEQCSICCGSGHIIWFWSDLGYDKENLISFPSQYILLTRVNVRTWVREDCCVTNDNFLINDCNKGENVCWNCGKNISRLCYLMLEKKIWNDTKG